MSKEIGVLNDLKSEKEAGNRDAARIYDRILQLATRIHNLEFPEKGKRSSIDQIIIEMLKDEKFFLINHASLIGKPQSYLQSLKNKSRINKQQSNEKENQG
jgi:hypothetical protein